MGRKRWRIWATCACWLGVAPTRADEPVNGVASWYGAGFDGRTMANGQPYRMNGLSAASKTLPLGSWVRVRNLNNGLVVEVPISDRGPYIRGRDIDMSKGAAHVLGMIDAGIVPVLIERIAKPRRRG